MAEPALTSSAKAATDDIVPGDPNSIRADLIAHNHGGTVTPIVAGDTIKPLPGARTHSIPTGADDTMAVLAAAQTLTNKTLTTPVIASIYQDAAKTKLMTVPDAAS